MRQFLDILLDGASILSKVESLRIERMRDQAVDTLTLGLADYSLYSEFDFGALPAAERIQVATAAGDPTADGSTAAASAILTSASSSFIAAGVTTDDLLMILSSPIAADVGSWPVTAIGATTLTTPHTFGPAREVVFVVLKNQGKFFVEKPDVLEDKNHVGIPSLWGRNGLARLTDPFAPKITRDYKTATTFYLLVKDLVAQAGMDASKVQFDISDYAIPANLYNVKERYPLDIVVELATKTNGYVRGKKDGNLWIKKNLFHFGALPVAKSVGDADVSDPSTESIDYPAFGNRILISSSVQSSGQSVRIQFKLSTECLRGDGKGTTDAEAVVTDSNGEAVADGTLVTWTIDDAGKATWLKTSSATEQKQIVDELHNASDLSTVSTDYPIRAVSGVFLISDTNKADNFFTGGSFKASAITLGKELPFSDSAVYVTYTAAGIAKNVLASKKGAAEGETFVHAAIGKVRDTATFCINNSINAQICLTADVSNHNLCIIGTHQSNLSASVEIDGKPAHGIMIQWIVNGDEFKGSVSPKFSSVRDTDINGEVEQSFNKFTVGTKHQISGVTGVWLLAIGKNGTNFYTNGQDRKGSFVDNVITLGTDLPAENSQVIIDYKGIGVATAVYTARSQTGTDEVVARINDGTLFQQGKPKGGSCGSVTLGGTSSDNLDAAITIETVNDCGSSMPTDSGQGKDGDCSKSVDSAKSCDAANPGNTTATKDCICAAESGGEPCPSNDPQACRDLCTAMVNRYGLDPLGCDAVVTTPTRLALEQAFHTVILDHDAHYWMKCNQQCSGDPDCMPGCVATAQQDTIDKCAQECINAGLSISPATAHICTAAGKKVTFTAKGGKAPYSWSATVGVLRPAADGLTAELTPPENTGSGVAGDAWKLCGRWRQKSGAFCNGPFCYSTRFGCNDQELFAGCLAGDCSGTDNCFPCDQGPICEHGTTTCANGSSAFNSNTEVCAPCKNEGAACDVRSQSMIDAGCNPCGTKFQSGGVVTVTDSQGRSASAVVSA